MGYEQDIKEAAGHIQLCAGHQAGPESAIYTMKTIFQEDQTEGVLLIEASNAFNSIELKLFVTFKLPALEPLHSKNPQTRTSTFKKQQPKV